MTKAQETVDLITFTEEIPNGKTSFFVQCEMKMKKGKVRDGRSKLVNCSNIMDTLSMDKTSQAKN